MANNPTSFKSALSYPSRTMVLFFNKIEQQKIVLQHIHEVLPATLALHALHCVINGKKLLVYTDTAAWASQLRFYSGAILTAIAPVCKEPVSIMAVKIMAGALPAPPLPGRKPIIPSAEKIAFIHNQSLTVSDQDLKSALQRLSATLAKFSS